MYDYLLPGKCTQIRERKVNNQYVMIKVTYLTPTIVTCALEKTNANLSSSLTKRKYFLTSIRTPEYLFPRKNFFKESRSRQYQQGFENQRWAKRKDMSINPEFIAYHSFIHLFT